MFTRVLHILLLAAFLVLLTHPGSAALPRSGDGEQTLDVLQDHLSAVSSQQEKRNDDGALQKVDKLFTVLHPEDSPAAHRIRPLITNDVPDLPSLLVYTQTTSTFLQRLFPAVNAMIRAGNPARDPCRPVGWANHNFGGDVHGKEERSGEERKH